MTLPTTGPRRLATGGVDEPLLSMSYCDGRRGDDDAAVGLLIARTCTYSRRLRLPVVYTLTGETSALINAFVGAAAGGWVHGDRGMLTYVRPNCVLSCSPRTSTVCSPALRLENVCKPSVVNHTSSEPRGPIY